MSTLFADVSKLIKKDSAHNSFPNKICDLKKIIFCLTYDIPIDPRGKIRRKECLIRFRNDLILQALVDPEYEKLDAKQRAEALSHFALIPAFGCDNPYSLATFITSHILTFQNPRDNEYVFITDADFSIECFDIDILTTQSVSDIYQYNFNDDKVENPLDENCFMIEHADVYDGYAKQIYVLQNFHLSIEDKLKLVASYLNEIPNQLGADFSFMKKNDFLPYFNKLGKVFNATFYKDSFF